MGRYQFFRDINTNIKKFSNIFRKDNRRRKIPTKPDRSVRSRVWNREGLGDLSGGWRVVTGFPGDVSLGSEVDRTESSLF